MPIKRRRSDCFCLLTALVLACDTPTPVVEERQADPTQPMAIARPAGPAESGPYNLRGTPMKGRTRHVEVIGDITAQLTVKVGPITTSGTMVLHTQNTEDLEILEVSDGMVSQGRLSHTVDRTTGTIRMSVFGIEGDPETEEEYGELHGRVELIEQRGGKWTRELVGAPPSPALVRELEGPPIDDAYYPTAIRVGESWTVTGPELRRWMGSDFNTTRGEVKNTLVAIEAQPEETIAVIEGVGEIGGTMPDEDGRESDFTMTLKVTERRSLERAMEIEVDGSGSIQCSGNFVEDGLPVSLSMSGPLTIRIKGALL